MGFSELLAFTIATTLLVASPGPNGVLIARTVPESGKAAGFATVAGFFLAFYVHGTLSILGLSIILMKSAVAFAIVKYLGAAYLIWVGLKALHAALKGAAPVQGGGPMRRPRSLWRCFLEGLLTNGLNPKVSVFYLAVFPNFIPVGAHPVASAYLLVFIHSMINIVWFTMMILLFARLAKAARGVRFQRWVKGLTGAFFIGFGLKLAAWRPAI